MAIPYIQLGRVELDPMGVPVAASMQQDPAEQFEQLLRDSVTDEPRDLADAGPDAVEQEVDASPSDADLADVDDDARRSERDAEATPEELDAADPEALGEQVDVTDSLRRNDPEQTQNHQRPRVEPAARGAAPAHEPLIAAAFHAQHKSLQPLTGDATPPRPIQAAQGRSGEPLLRGAGSALLAHGSTAKSAHVQTGYATKSAHSMQLLEQARDSVFKQILMKLTEGGGEMRMRLAPPDLGQLDLRMTVEGGNKLTLVIAADRSDMAQLLQRHIEELKGTLQENGLEVTGAEVQTREDFERQQAADDATDDATPRHTDDFTEDAASAPQTRGYITADGLDFWA